MTIKIFAEPLDAVESPKLDVPLVTRILFAGLASLVAIIPALTTAFTAFRVSRFISTLTNAENATALNVTTSLHLINTPLVVALGICALLAFVLALVLAIDPQRRLASVGLPLSIAIPLIAALPAMLLWSAETTTIDIVTNRYTGGESVAELAQRISMLLLGAIAWGALAGAIAFACSAGSLFFPVRRRTEADSLRRAFVWAVTGMLLLVFAGAWFIVV